jgi:hypothetical protein
MSVRQLVAGVFAVGVAAGPMAPAHVLASPVASGVAAHTVAVPAPAQPRLVAVAARHHPGFDRVAFVFEDGIPSSVRARYVDRLVADPSGLPVRLAGNAVLEVSLEPTTWTEPPVVARRTAFTLPNVMTLVRSGAFEGVTSFGIGLTQRTTFQVRRVPSRHRVLVDIRASFPTVMRKVYFLDRDRFVANTQPFFVSRRRPVRATSPARDALQRFFAGPLARERAHGLRLLRSGATGFSHLTVASRIARVRLVGGCDSRGSTVTVADGIIPTLRQFPSVDWVKVYSPAGRTADPTGPSDSIPGCLNP